MADRSRPAPPQWQIALAFLAVYLVWGSSYLAIRFVVETLPPFTAAGARFLTAGALLYAWTGFRGVPAPRPVEWRSALVTGGLIILVGNGAVCWAERMVPSGIAALLVAATPFWMAVLDWLRPGGHRPSRQAALGLLGGFVGVLVLVGPGRLASGGAVAPAGAGALTLACIGWAAGSLLSRQASLPESPLMSTAAQMLCGGFLQLLAGLAFGEWAHFHPAAASARSIAALIYLILVGSLIGFTSYLWLLRVTTPARAATYAYVNPVVAVFLGWALAGEPLTTRAIAAAAVILTSVALISTARGGPDSRKEVSRAAAAE